VIVVQLAVNGLLLGGLYLLMAQGLNLVFGVMRIVNLAHGVLIVVAGLIVYRLNEAYGINPLLAVALVAPAFFVLGALLQRLLIERIKAVGIQGELLSLMLTYGLSYIFISVALHAFGAQYLSLPYLQSSLEIGSVTINESLLVASGVAVLLAGGLYGWLTYTPSGKQIRATSQSRVGAVSCGIDTRRVRMIAFATGSALAAAAGTLLVVVRPVAPQLADDFTVLAFVVIMLGGLGNYLGAAVGAFLLGAAQSFGGYYLGPEVESALPFVAMLLIMLIRPQGLQPRVAR
jgi:branched-chain amino acid transport system permease protein